MLRSSLYRLTNEDLPRAVECLKDAFKDDPLWAEVFKNDPDRERALTGFYTCPLLYGMKYGKAYAVSPEIQGVAVWVPGRYSNMSMWGMLRCGALSYGLWMGKETMRNMAIVSKQLGPDRNSFMKNKPYSYLMIIGVSSAAQQKGLGSIMMDLLKEESDRDGLYLYLETEKEENVPFYEKHGFTVLQKIVFKKLNLPMWEMERRPR